MAQTSAVRPTKEQIDLGILDAAAEIFAVRGYDGTSLQQVADAVGYSKTGLLHRFPSKHALYEAIVVDAEGVLSTLLEDIDALPDSASTAVVGLITGRAIERPGLVDLVVSSLRPAGTSPMTERFEQLALQVVGALGPGERPRERLRVVLALQLVVNAVLAQREDLLQLRLPPEELHELVTDLAVRVLDPR